MNLLEIGRTAIFSIAILQRIDINLRECQALILAPTEELATQIQKEIIALGNEMSVKCGTNMELESNRVLVGTPATISDMVNSGVLHTREIRMFALDEADAMLSRGFKSQIQAVFSVLPKDIQIIMLSATMPTEVLDVSKDLMRNPIQILVKKKESTPENVPSKTQDIDIALMYSKFAQKVSETGTIKKKQINEILQDAGFAIHQFYIDGLCTKIGVTEEINIKDFQTFAFMYTQIMDIHQNPNSPTVSSSMSDDSESYKNAKRAKMESINAALDFMNQIIIQKNVRKGKVNGKRVPRRCF